MEEIKHKALPLDYGPILPRGSYRMGALQCPRRPCIAVSGHTPSKSALNEKGEPEQRIKCGGCGGYFFRPLPDPEPGVA